MLVDFGREFYDFDKSRFLNENSYFLSLVDIKKQLFLACVSRDLTERNVFVQQEEGIWDSKKVSLKLEKQPVCLSKEIWNSNIASYQPTFLLTTTIGYNSICVD